MRPEENNFTKDEQDEILNIINGIFKFAYNCNRFTANEKELLYELSEIIYEIKRKIKE